MGGRDGPKPAHGPFPPTDARSASSHQAGGDEGLTYARIEERADLRRALVRLPPRRRDVAIFYYYLDLDVAEIARALRISEGTVKSSLHRARQALAAALDDDREEVDDVARR